MNNELKDIVDQMEPEQALPIMAAIIKKILPLVDDKTRVDFVVQLIGETGNDKVASLVDL